MNKVASFPILGVFYEDFILTSSYKRNAITIYKMNTFCPFIDITNPSFDSNNVPNNAIALPLFDNVI